MKTPRTRKTTNLSFVSDWGGFEKFIAELNKTGEVKVERNVKLTGPKGEQRQIDVLITHKLGLITQKIICECKYWKTKIKRQHVDSMAYAIQQTGAYGGIFFTTQGAQSGAVTVATGSNINIFKVRDLSQEEWGSSGRYLDYYIHYYYRSGVQMDLREIHGAALDPRFLTTPITIDLELGTNTPKHTMRSSVDMSPMKSLEEVIDRVSYQTLTDSFRNDFCFNEDRCDKSYDVTRELVFEPTRWLNTEAGELLISKLDLRITLSVRQERFHYDRMTPFTIATVIENCVDNTVHLATRRAGKDITSYEPLHAPHPRADKLKNGMVFKVWLPGWGYPRDVDFVEGQAVFTPERDAAKSTVGPA